MTEFWFVRHGQTNWNIEARYQGQKNIPLNETGIQDATRLSLELAKFPFAAIYCSDLSRAAQTALILSSTHELKIEEDMRLREVYLGEWEGQLFDDIKKYYPEYLIKRLKDIDLPCAPKGEKIVQVVQRVKSFLDEVEAAYPDQKILVVSHGMLIAICLCLVNNRPLVEAYSLIPNHLTPQKIVWKNI